MDLGAPKHSNSNPYTRSIALFSGNSKLAVDLAKLLKEKKKLIRFLSIGIPYLNIRRFRSGRISTILHI